MSAITAPMSGDEDLGAYATEAGIQFFGKKKRKGCDRRKKSCYRGKPRRFKNAKSPCGGLKRKTCRSTTGCSYVKKRGCRNRKDAAILVAGAVAGVPEAVAAVPAVAEAVANTAERAEQLALTAGASPEEAAKVGVAAGGAQAVEEAAAAGVPEESLALVQQTAEERAAANRRAYDALPADSMERLDFGRRRRARFGNVCKPFKDTTSCVTYRDLDGKFPCNWSGGSNNWCANRPKAVAYDEVIKGKYADIIKSVITPPVAPAAAAAAPAVTQKTVSEVCKGLDQLTCGTFGMCQWVSGDKLKRCQARRGYGGKNWEGALPGAAVPTAAEVAAEEARGLMFGRRRYNVPGSRCNLKRKDCKVAEYCKYTRRGCRRKAGAKSLGLAFGGFNISKLAKLAKKIKLPKGADLKKLKAKLDKHSDKLGEHLDTLHEIANENNEAEKLTASFGGFSLSKLASLAKKVKLPKGADLKKLKSKLEKHANTLEKHYDTLNEIANGKESEKLTTSFGGFSLSKLTDIAKKLKGKLSKNLNTITGHLDKINEGESQAEAEKLTAAFGKKRRSTYKRKTSRRKGCRSKGDKKLPAKIRKLCKKLKIKTTKKVGSRRVCKKLSVLKKQIARKLRKMKKSSRKVHRKVSHRRRTVSRR
jgi:endonuclease V-like protein UPF0215 family